MYLIVYMSKYRLFTFENNETNRFFSRFASLLMFKNLWY
jgi:hypothetical protein